MAANMERVATFDTVGRLVIPRPLRDRLRLEAGTRLFISEEEGRLVLSVERTEPRLADRDGILVLELEPRRVIAADFRDVREERKREFVSKAPRT